MPHLQSTILFTDVVGSSRLYAELGNNKAKETIDSIIQMVAGCVHKYRGSIIKTIGDEAMAAFINAEDAFNSAIEINKAVDKQGMCMRTGICFGQVIRDQSDFFGDTVNNAAYLTKIAQAGQILTEKHTLARLPPILHSQCELFDHIALKGEKSKTQIYRVSWEDQDKTVMEATQLSVIPSTFNVQKHNKLTIVYGDQKLSLLPGADKLLIGRDHSSVNLCIPVSSASRVHCSIYYSRQKFVLEDQSTNGTYIYPELGESLFLRRETTPLSGYGLISIGTPKENTANILHYKIETH